MQSSSYEDLQMKKSKIVDKVSLIFEISAVDKFRKKKKMNLTDGCGTSSKSSKRN